MNKILEKRDSLEQFIREQTLGPGIRGYRFVDLENEKIFTKDLLLEKPINYENEIIDAMPASLYSTGILFPKDNSNTRNEGRTLENKVSDDEENDASSKTLNDTEDEETIDLNQSFPMTMGITFCLDEKFLEKGNLGFDINARIYKKIENLENIAILSEANKQEVLNFLQKYNLKDDFQIIAKGLNNFITLKKLTDEKYSELKMKIRDSAKKEAEQIYIEKIKNSINSIPNKQSSFISLSSIIQTIYYELKNNVYSDEKKKNLYNVSQELELVENILGHLNGLLDIRLNKNPWRSDKIKLKVQIKNIQFPKNKRKQFYLSKDSIYPNNETIIVTHSDGTNSNGLKNIFLYKINNKEEASLSANIQFSRDSRKKNGKVFVKIQLINDGSPFIKEEGSNTYYSVATQKVNNKCFFGVNISIADEFLVPYSENIFISESGKYTEDTTTQFIYRQFEDYTIGHGCSVKWDLSGDLKKIETEYLPSCETPDIEPIPRDKSKVPFYDEKGNVFILPTFLKNTKVQEFKWLSIFSDASDQEILKELLGFVNSYKQWIESNRHNSDKQYSELINQELKKCDKDYNRMRTNIEGLLSGDKNKQNLKTFRLMNSSMFMQLLHSNFKKAEYKEINLIINEPTFSSFDFNFYKSYKEKEPTAWRAFQLAFILLNLDGIFQDEFDKDWKYRNNWVDLVWFPTGGGKTEAYLGLIALTILNRRVLLGERGGGTAAIMRYTLRLLTTQQFQRATILVMALELIRRWNKFDLGQEPITIGLWVGDNSIPNKIIGLKEEFQKFRANKGNRIPFSSCPWCGAKLLASPNEIKDTDLIFHYNKLHLSCTNNKCNFYLPEFDDNILQDALPINLCDESIYQHPPTLLFGTVDKFAQLAHKVSNDAKNRHQDSRRLFGKGNWEQGKPQNGYLPPDLIIQDELHLLMGPLGSAVALFESAIDQLCTRTDGTRPKIISSTATTRNTELQIAALFDRKVNLFPKPGIDCDDSFFAFYKRKYANEKKDTKEYLSKRKYIGFLPTGRTQIWMQMRLAAILFTHRAIFELKELGEFSPIDFDKYEPFKKAMDYYHTIISYFNSLKEVGKTQSQVQSYIKKEIRKVFTGVILPKKLMHALYTYNLTEAELTGRLSGEDVKTQQENVEHQWDASKRFAYYRDKNDSKSEVIKGKTPPEFVVATNMISVGLDISRFNTIIVNSMPRNIAEYIQATSRVARSEPGLVLTIHHPFRARDVSHYEKFIEFHEKMYSYVEPISITPFTEKAVNRYLGLYFATILRHTINRFVGRNSADNINTLSEADYKQIVDSIVDYFHIRSKRMEKQFSGTILDLLKEKNVNYIKRWIEEAFVEWKNLKSGIDSRSILVFNNKSEQSNPSQEQLYVDIEEYDGNIHSEKWQIPMSLRVIEPEAAIKIYSN